jgi:hypothetical protein
MDTQHYSSYIQKLLDTYHLKQKILINASFNGVTIDSNSSLDILLQVGIEKLRSLKKYTSSQQDAKQLHLIIVVPHHYLHDYVFLYQLNAICSDYGYTKEAAYSSLTSFWIGKGNITLTSLAHLKHILHSHTAVIIAIGFDDLFLRLHHIRTLMFAPYLTEKDSRALQQGYVYSNAQKIQWEKQLDNYLCIE